MTRHQRSVVGVTLVALAAIGVSPRIHWAYRLLYNPSESAPRGWYAIVPTQSIRIDDYVLVRLPQDIANLAAERAYLPLTVPLLKHVSAIGGRNVCELSGVLTVDRHTIARARDIDGDGRRLVAWTGCRTLASDEVLLISTTSDASFDSRYFGPLRRNSILARAIPLWTW